MRQQEAARLQSLERQGDLISRAQEREQVGTLLGMSQAEAAAYGQARAQATQAKFDAISSGVTGIANIGIAGLQAGAFNRPQQDSTTLDAVDSRKSFSNFLANRRGQQDQLLR
jgi:hypothetical protein